MQGCLPFHALFFLYSLEWKSAQYTTSLCESLPTPFVAACPLPAEFFQDDSVKNTLDTTDRRVTPLQLLHSKQWHRFSYEFLRWSLCASHPEAVLLAICAQTRWRVFLWLFQCLLLAALPVCHHNHGINQQLHCLTDSTSSNGGWIYVLFRWVISVECTTELLSPPP